ncbi:MAG: tRNA pseudouridine(55) synthase TruB [Clostridia bacterium]|nr:tRNA pseudouridine(55) synthase TruB [Clostridia bacterium]
MANFEGIVNVLKPPGMTSSDAVCDLRHIFNMKRVGHMGTLDPGASGVLPIALGRATRLFDYLVEKQKRYIAEVTFGAETETQDSYGEILTSDDRIITREDIEGVLPYFRGDIVQKAPIYSALNQNGVKLYKLARQGKEIEEKYRDATIFSLDVIKEMEKNKFLIDVVCSKGTYIRTLCHDIGKKLGTHAYMSFLLRTSTGVFTLENSFSIAELRKMKEEGTLERAVMSTEDVLASFNTLDIKLSKSRYFHLLNGIPAPLCEAKEEVSEFPENTPLRLYCNGDFLGVGIIENSEVRLALNFTETK